MFQQVKIKVVFYFVANGTFYSNLFEETRIHSSRMCTVRCSGRREGVYPSMHWAGGVCLPACTGQGVSAWRRVSAWGGVFAQGGVCSSACLDTPPPLCVCPGRFVCPSASPEGVSAEVYAGIHPLLTEFLTHACENITFPQLRCGR